MEPLIQATVTAVSVVDGVLDRLRRQPGVCGSAVWRLFQAEGQRPAPWMAHYRAQATTS